MFPWDLPGASRARSFPGLRSTSAPPQRAGTLLCQSRALPVRWARQHCYRVTQRLRKARFSSSKGQSRPRLGWPAALLRAGSLRPVSLVGSAREASRTTFTDLLQLPRPSGAASLVYPLPILQKTPAARQEGCLPAGRGEGKAEHPSAAQAGSRCSPAAEPAALCDPSLSGGIRNMGRSWEQSSAGEGKSTICVLPSSCRPSRHIMVNSCSPRTSHQQHASAITADARWEASHAPCHKATWVLQMRDTSHKRPLDKNVNIVPHILTPSACQEETITD